MIPVVDYIREFHHWLGQRFGSGCTPEDIDLRRRLHREESIELDYALAVAYLAMTLAPIAVAAVLIWTLNLRGDLALVLMTVTAVTAVSAAVGLTQRRTS